MAAAEQRCSTLEAQGRESALRVDARDADHAAMREAVEAALAEKQAAEAQLAELEGTVVRLSESVKLEKSKLADAEQLVQRLEREQLERRSVLAESEAANGELRARLRAATSPRGDRSEHRRGEGKHAGVQPLASRPRFASPVSTKRKSGAKRAGVQSPRTPGARPQPSSAAFSGARASPLHGRRKAGGAAAFEFAASDGGSLRTELKKRKTFGAKAGKRSRPDAIKAAAGGMTESEAEDVFS